MDDMEKIINEAAGMMGNGDPIEQSTCAICGSEGAIFDDAHRITIYSTGKVAYICDPCRSDSLDTEPDDETNGESNDD